MKKIDEIKIFGIGAAVLFVLMALTPVMALTPALPVSGALGDDELVNKETFVSENLTEAMNATESMINRGATKVTIEKFNRPGGRIIYVVRGYWPKIKIDPIDPKKIA